MWYGRIRMKLTKKVFLHTLHLLLNNLKNAVICLEMISKRSRDHMKRPEMEITLFPPTKKEMRNKKWNVKRTNQNIMNIFEMNSIMHRSSQQIIPKHNKYIEQCDIWKNREYEENLSKKTFLTHFSCSRKSWKIHLYAY